MMSTGYGVWKELGMLVLFFLGLVVLIAPWFLGKACLKCKENTWDYDSWPGKRICTHCGAVEDLRK